RNWTPVLLTNVGTIGQIAMHFGTNAGPRQFFRAEPLVNAWQISDFSNGGSSSSRLWYATNLTTAQKAAAFANGWRFTVTSRLVDDFGGSRTMCMIVGDVGDNTRRFPV